MGVLPFLLWGLKVMMPPAKLFVTKKVVLCCSWLLPTMVFLVILSAPTQLPQLQKPSLLLFQVLLLLLLLPLTSSLVPQLLVLVPSHPPCLLLDFRSLPFWLLFGSEDTDFPF